MHTINTIEDLMQLLDRNPQWLEALRSRVLTRELIELPARFAQSVEQNNRFREEMNRFREEMNRFAAATDRRFERLETRFERMLDDVGVLKGAHARNAAIEEATTIARDMGLRRIKTLTRDDVWDLTDSADTGSIDSADLRSFRRADLIMEATDEAGDTCYVAVEISFTANGRDTKRVLRNADLLSRFTGRRAYAAVAGIRRDDRIGDSIDSGTVLWHQLDPEIMEVE